MDRTIQDTHPLTGGGFSATESVLVTHPEASAARLAEIEKDEPEFLEALERVLRAEAEQAHPAQGPVTDAEKAARARRVAQMCQGWGMRALADMAEGEAERYERAAEGEKMRLWLLARSGPVGCDEVAGFVVRAAFEDRARWLASGQAGDEGDHVWLLDARAFALGDATGGGAEGIVLRDKRES